MIINPDHIRKAEEILINGERFDEERREFIKCMDTLDLLAVPGSGKTTALLAKLYCIAQQLPLENNAGILVLSHTNHAIEEIEKNLKPICPQLFSYPNFVGTVQSFANKFIANQACFELYGSYIRKNDDEISNQELISKFSNINFKSKLNGFIFNQVYSQFATVKIVNIESYFSLKTSEAKTKLAELKREKKVSNKGVCNYSIIKNISKKDENPTNCFLRKIHDSSIKEVNKQKLTFCLRYKVDFIKRKFTSKSGDLSFDSDSGKELLSYFEYGFKNGILRYSDSVALSLYYITLQRDLINILQRRFKFVFIDEMQDLDQDQVELIENIFFTSDSKTIIQRIGDKNQAIYSSKSLESEIVWKTRYEINPEKYHRNFTLNNSYRLTPTIANLVDGFVLARDEGYKVVGISENQNIKPYLLVYNDASDAEKLKNKFVDLIKLYELDKNSKNIERGFHIIAWTTDKEGESDKWHLRKLFPEYSKESKQKKEDFDCLRKYLFLFDHNKKTYESIRKSLLNGIIRILRIEQIYLDANNRKHFRKSSFIQYLKDTNPDFYDDFKQRLFNWCYSIISLRNYEEIFVEYSNFIKNEIIGLFPDYMITLSNNFIDQYFDFAIKDETIEEGSKNDIHIKLGSIHSVKGQTHCATLYLETDYHTSETAKLNFEIVSGAKRNPAVFGNNPLFFQGQNFSHLNKVRANETLKMMYVGFSRPTHLLCFAAKKKSVENDLEKYIAAGWNVEDISKKTKL